MHTKDEVSKKKINISLQRLMVCLVDIIYLYKVIFIDKSNGNETGLCWHSTLKWKESPTFQPR